ncbi:unnamed protein product [Amoebophrya sp. A120]|nr:unnamed protein product [Amoebophrya sp. A120]|eukprot:GSA120T00008918001.1
MSRLLNLSVRLVALGQLHLAFFKPASAVRLHAAGGATPAATPRNANNGGVARAARASARRDAQQRQRRAEAPAAERPLVGGSRPDQYRALQRAKEAINESVGGVGAQPFHPEERALLDREREKIQQTLDMVQSCCVAAGTAGTALVASSARQLQAGQADLCSHIIGATGTVVLMGAAACAQPSGAFTQGLRQRLAVLDRQILQDDVLRTREGFAREVDSLQRLHKAAERQKQIAATSRDPFFSGTARRLPEAPTP